MLQVQRGLQVQGRGHDQPDGPQGMEAHVQSAHHQGASQAGRGIILTANL